MALIIEQFSSWVNSPNGDIGDAIHPPLATENIAVGSSSVSSALLHASTKLVRLSLDSGNARVLIGATGTAVTNSTGSRLSTSMPPVYFGVAGNQGSHVVAVITGS